MRPNCPSSVWAAWRCAKQWATSRLRRAKTPPRRSSAKRSASASSRPEMEDLVLWNATIVDVRSSTPRERMAIAMRGGKITDVCNVDGSRPPHEAIDIGGAYIVPGLIDAHIHLGDDPGDDGRACGATGDEGRGSSPPRACLLRARQRRSRFPALGHHHHPRRRLL